MRDGHTGPDTLMLSHNPPKMCRTEGGGGGEVVGRWWGGDGERERGGEETGSRICMCNHCIHW